MSKPTVIVLVITRNPAELNDSRTRNEICRTFAGVIQQQSPNLQVRQLLKSFNADGFRSQEFIEAAMCENAETREQFFEAVDTCRQAYEALSAQQKNAFERLTRIHDNEEQLFDEIERERIAEETLGGG